jgi:hypothetical protein
MSFWNIFKKSSGSDLSRQVKRYQSRLMNKWIDQSERYNAIDRLLELGTDEAYDVMLKRFTFLIENTIKDNEEKQYLYERLLEKRREMVEPLLRYLRREDEISWPLRALSKIVDAEELTTTLIQLLAEMDPLYSRHNDKKVILLDMLRERPGKQVFNGIAPFLEDTDDDVRIKAIETVAHEQNRELLRDLLIKMLLEVGDRPRIQRKAADELARLGWDVKGYQTAVPKSLPEGFFLDKKGHIKRREE